MVRPNPARPSGFFGVPAGRTRILQSILCMVSLCGSAHAATPADSTAAAVARPDSNRSGLLPSLGHLQGIIEGDARLQRLRFPGDDARSASDLYLRRFQVAGAGNAGDWLSAQFVLNVEYLGLAGNTAPPSILLDEGHLDLGRSETSPYLVLGMRSQPFGQFESHLVTDPLTQQAYELKATGLTVGHTGPYGLDGNLTLYKGAEHLDGLFAASFFDTTRVRRQPHAMAHAESFVAAAEVSPVAEHATVYGALVSEPGADRRNLTVDVAATLAPSRPGFVCDVEWIRALQRETYAGAGRSFADGALSVTAAFVFAYRHHVLHHRRTFAGRRAHIRSHRMVAAVRYDRFDDDGLAEALHSWSMRDRWSLGGRYTWVDVGNASLYGMAEVGSTRFRGAAANSVPESERDVLVRLGLTF